MGNELINQKSQPEANPPLAENINPPAGGQNENVKCKNYFSALHFYFFLFHFAF